MLPRATQNLEYGTISVWLSLIAALIVVDATKTQKNELIKRLDEVEKGIEMFSKKQVFIQV